MVRDGGGDPLNDVEMAAAGRAQNLFNNEMLLEGSMYRNEVDEAAGFQDVLMAGAQDQPMLFDQAAQGGDPGMVGLNFFDKDGGISPLKGRPLRQAPQFIDFEGFGLPS